MISRVWHGWTTKDDADEYEGMLRTDILPGIHRVKGFLGAYVLRRAVGNEVEFITITQFTDMQAVKDFAGDDCTLAVIHPRAQRVLVRFDERSVHYDTVLTPEEMTGK
jgi:heme-degrading monooxygenase HmoA